MPERLGSDAFRRAVGGVCGRLGFVENRNGKSQIEDAEEAGGEDCRLGVTEELQIGKEMAQLS
jgi:hypothetical protein